MFKDGPLCLTSEIFIRSVKVLWGSFNLWNSCWCIWHFPVTTVKYTDLLGILLNCFVNFCYWRWRCWDHSLCSWALWNKHGKNSSGDQCSLLFIDFLWPAHAVRSVVLSSLPSKTLALKIHLMSTPFSIH